MLYTMPKNKTWTDLCVEFDKEFYTPSRDDNKLYKYLYLIFYISACNKNYFHKFDDYNYFAQFAATTIYTRCLRKEKKGEKIKSIKNYINSALYPLKVMFQNEHFFNIKNPEFDKKLNSDAIQQKMRDSVQSSYNYDLTNAIQESLKLIPNICYKVIHQTPYKNDEIMCRRLEISCLLTFLNSITLSKEDELKYLNKTKKSPSSDLFLLKMLDKENNSNSILWRLDSNLNSYIKILVNKIKFELGNVIEKTKNNFVIEDNILDSIIASAYAKKGNLEYEE